MTIEPDAPDDVAPTSEQDDPRGAVDELEAGVVRRPEGDTPDPAEDDPPSPAFDLDLEPEEQGTAEAAAGNPE
jgi:hypothetical protein